MSKPYKPDSHQTYILGQHVIRMINYFVKLFEFSLELPKKSSILDCLQTTNIFNGFDYFLSKTDYPWCKAIAILKMKAFSTLGGILRARTQGSVFFLLLRI